MKVDMLIIERAIVLTHADLVASGTCSVFNDMNEMMFLKQRQRAEQRASLGWIEGIFQLLQRQGALRLHQRTKHHQPHGRRLDAVVRQAFHQLLFIH